MDIKDAILADMQAIPEYTGKIDADEMFWEYRLREESRINSANAGKIQIVFFRVGDNMAKQRIRNKSEQFEFHFIGDLDMDPQLEAAKNILVQHYCGFRGVIGGSDIRIHAVRYETGNEKIDDEMREKTIFVRMTFDYIQPLAVAIP